MVTYGNLCNLALTVLLMERSTVLRGIDIVASGYDRVVLRSTSASCLSECTAIRPRISVLKLFFIPLMFSFFSLTNP